MIKRALLSTVEKENKFKLENTTFSENKIVSQHAQREKMNSLSSVTSFAKGMNVHLHVNRLQICSRKKVYISGRNNEDQLEISFVRNAKKL